MLIYRQGLEIQGAALTPEEAGTEQKFQLTSLLITPDGTVVGCDGHLWLRMQALAKTPDADLFTEQQRAALPELLPGPVMVPADVAKAFLAASKRKAKKGQKPQQIVVAVKDGQVTLATADGKTRRTFVIEPGELPFPAFPAFERTIPRGAPRVRVELGVEKMLKVLTTLKRCGVGCVELILRRDDEPIRLAARTYIDDSECIVDGVLMPLRSDKRDDVDPTTGEVFDAADGNGHEGAETRVIPEADFTKKLQKECRKKGWTCTRRADGQVEIRVPAVQ